MSNDTKALLAKRRAEEHAKNIQEQMAQRAAAVEAFGATLGNPVDFSAGVPTGPAPAARTGTTKQAPPSSVYIPTPPPEEVDEDAEAQAQAQAQAEAEEADYAAAMAEAGKRPKPVNPADFRSKKQPPLRKPLGLASKKPKHPLLAQLHTEFGLGIEENPAIDVQVADHKWSFVPLSPDLIALAARAADTMSETASEHNIRAKQAAVCFSVVAIDDIPTWEVLGLEPTERDDISQPRVPRGPLRQRAAVGLYGEMVSGLTNRLLDALYEAYMAKVDPAGRVKSYTAYEKQEHIVWVCREPDCTHQISRPRRYDDERNEQSYFCELHGAELFPVDSTKPRIDEDLGPLE